MRSKLWRGVLVAVLLIVVLLVVGVYWALGPAWACRFPARGPAEAGLSARTLTSSGVERCYLLYTPPSYETTQSVPVVFSLHGFAGTPQGLRGMTGWEGLADTENFLVVYPHGSSFPLRWNTHPGANIGHIDDVQFIRDILADLSGVAAVDGTRVYVTGFSNGGTMTDQIACQLADSVAAVGMVSGKGEEMQAECSPSRPVPIIAFFGTEDPLDSADYPLWFLKLINVSPVLKDLEYLSVETWLDRWIQRNGCNSSPEIRQVAGDAGGAFYTGCGQNAEIVVVTIDQGGHTWPGGSNLPVFGKTSTNVDASRTMWDFFKEHPLQSVP